jgi:hypothetical protein
VKTIEVLRLQFPGRVLIPVLEAGQAIGYAQSTVRGKLHHATFPLKTVKNGDMRMVHIVELAHYIDGLGATSKRGRGRPRKQPAPSPTCAAPPHDLDACNGAAYLASDDQSGPRPQ